MGIDMGVGLLYNMHAKQKNRYFGGKTMTKKELLAKNPKLADLDKILKKKANTSANRKEVEEIIKSNFGESSSIEDVFDLLEYYDLMTNDTTLIGSNIFDSTVFEPIKELVSSYIQDLADLKKLYEADQSRFKKILKNAHELKNELRSEQEAHSRTRKEAFELGARVNELTEHIEEDNEKLKLAKLSPKLQVKYVVGLEKKSKEWEASFGQAKKELAEAQAANTKANEALDESQNENAELKKKIKNKNIDRVILGGLLVAAVGTAILLACASKSKDKGNSDSTIQPVPTDDVELAKEYAANQCDALIKVGNNVYALMETGKESLEASINALDKESGDVVAQAKETAEKSKVSVETAMSDINETMQYVTENKAAAEQAGDFVTALNCIAKNTQYTVKMAGYITEASKAFGNVQYAFETAYSASSEAKEALAAEKEALQIAYDNYVGKVNNFVADMNDILETEDTDLSGVKDSVVSFKEDAEQKYNELYTVTMGLIDNTYATAGLSWADVHVENGKITTFSVFGERCADIELSEEGEAAYATGEDTAITTVHIKGLGENVRLFEGVNEVLKQAYAQQDDPTHTQGNSDSGEATPTAEENDEGKIPESTTEPGNGNLPSSPSGQQNQNADENSTTGSEIVDENSEKEEGEPSFGNGGDNE